MTQNLFSWDLVELLDDEQRLLSLVSLKTPPSLHAHPMFAHLQVCWLLWKIKKPSSGAADSVFLVWIPRVELQKVEEKWQRSIFGGSALYCRFVSMLKANRKNRKLLCSCVGAVVLEQFDLNQGTSPWLTAYQHPCSQRQGWLTIKTEV